MFDWIKEAVWTPLSQAYSNWQADHGTLLAASISYYAALSFFPLLLVTISGLGYFLRFSGAGQDAKARLLDFIAEQSAQAVADLVRDTLVDVQLNAGIGGPIGLVTLLFTSMAIFTQFTWSFDRIWKLRDESKTWWDTIREVLWYRLKAFLMLLGAGLMIIITFLASMALSTVSKLSERHELTVPDWFWTAAQWMLALSLNTLLFTVIYKVVPRVHIRWLDALRGGALAAVVWEIGRQVLVAFLVGKQYGAYGVVGSFIAILLWIYYVSALLFFGAEVVHVLGGRERKPPAGRTLPMNVNQ